VSKLRHLGVALALAFGCAGVVAAGPAGVPVAMAAEALPECRYDDVMTSYTTRRDWQKTLVDTIYMIGPSYTPPGKLASTKKAGLNQGQYARRFVIPDLAALAAAARDNGTPLRVTSGYRDFEEQQRLYDREVRNFGLEMGRLRVARPGHSEHHLGTTLDFGSTIDRTPAWKFEDWATTPTGAFLKENAWRYGFVMSYPKDQQTTTCYQYEPWHWRYLGREMAAAVVESGLTLREYLWQNFH
jgi:zinc D-Ala-D-Ala carboxypeptidase